VEGLEAPVGGSPFLEEIAFELAPGRFVGLVGPNGSGKTTLLRAILGAWPRSAGRIELDGEALDALPRAEVARAIAVVPQQVGRDFPFRVSDFVALGRRPYFDAWGRTRGEDWEAIRAAMEEAEIEPFAGRAITTLSGGEFQRVLIARALAQTPRYLFLDEPTAHLDIGAQLALLDLVDRRRKEAGLGVLAVFHDLNLAAHYCEELLLLHRGRLIARGTCEEVLTPTAIAQAYGTPVRVRRHPITQRPFVLPLHGLPESPAPGAPLVHVIGGGGTAASLFRLLVGAGYRVSTGVLNLLDADLEAAEALNLPAITEAPFAPISAEADAALQRRLQEAAAVIVAPVPVGPGNLQNLHRAAEYAATGSVILWEPRGLAPLTDHTGGAGAPILSALRANAHRAGSGDELVALLQRLIPTAAPSGG